MKRVNNLFDSIISIENLYLADKKARRGKSKQPGIKKFDKNKDYNIRELHKCLKEGTYRTSEYTIFKVYDLKERDVYKLPYKDRIVHHAIMNYLEPVFVNSFTRDTYSCIKGRGIHGALRNMQTVLTDVDGTQYCLKLDINKFYPSVNHGILKSLLRKKIKDYRLLVFWMKL